MKKLALVIAFVTLLPAASAEADVLKLGSNYVPVLVSINGGAPQLEGGGSVGPSFLGAVSLPWVYCVDLYTNVYVPATYDATDVNATGIVHGAPLNNLGYVLSLLDQFAATAVTPEQQGALQAAIWHEIYLNEAGRSVDYAGTDVADYDRFIAAVWNDLNPVTPILFLTPNSTGSGNSYGYQALVTDPPLETPEPASLLLLGTGLVALGAVVRRRLS